MKKLIALLISLLVISTLSACTSSNAKVIKVGASPAPHAEILELIKPLLAEKGYTLEIV